MSGYDCQNRWVFTKCEWRSSRTSLDWWGCSEMLTETVMTVFTKWNDITRVCGKCCSWMMLVHHHWLCICPSGLSWYLHFSYWAIIREHAIRNATVEHLGCPVTQDLHTSDQEESFVLCANCMDNSTRLWTARIFALDTAWIHTWLIEWFTVT